MREDRKQFEVSSPRDVIARSAASLPLRRQGKQSQRLDGRLLRYARNDIRWTSHFKLLTSSVALLLLSVLVAGCRNRELDQARQEAREAKATINKLNYNLKMQAEEIALGKAELAAVRQDRDVLQKQKDQLIAEWDQAKSSAQQAQEAVTRLTTQATGQGSLTNALQKQVTELKTLVEEQQKLIELLKSGGAQPATPPAPPADKPGTPDPNAKP